MKKFLATLGFLLVATASHGEAGQHTGVGGNPAVPPPQPNGITTTPQFQSIILQPGIVFIIGDEIAQPQQDQKSEQDSESSDDSGE